ncbi:MAG: secondary thiamine-phosphate synthase enzyme YjbQ [Candidatus Nanohaloarchaeota archaeon QJJ-9]|nr:secondary thiamine-phosphate synthase enzyme YjbQ [Candidatus Nanohaloarchaeota archaeon QJJ-9]
MTVESRRLEIELEADGGMEDLTEKVERFVESSEVEEGAVTVYMLGSTGSVTTLEYEPGLQKDLPEAMEKLAPSGKDYKHHETWNDGNGRSHIRASIIGPEVTMPIINGELVHGTWQQVVAINWDTKNREREIVLQLRGK